ncbi:MAG: hypothetical protein HYZ44_03500 [Bacteroidetes bacterium]|nr:hypothetical protein [Bacteroidota bacterium]
MEKLTDFKTHSTGKRWLIGWSGDMKEIISFGSALVNLLIYPIKDEIPLNQFRAHISQLNLGGFRRVQVDVGYTPVYSIGSIIENDTVIARPKQFMPIQKVEVNLDYNNNLTLSIKEFHLTQKSRINDDGIIQTLFNYDFPLIMFHDAKVQVLRKGIEQDSNYDFIIVPCQEVFRFYFGGSDDISQELYLGGLHDPANRIYDPRYITPKSEIDNGVKPFIYLRTRIPDTDIKIVARIAYSDIGFKAAKSVYNSVQLAKMNKQQIYPDCKFPFEGKAELKICGTEIKANGFDNKFTNKKIFLVYNIISCSGPFPYSEIEYDRENSNLIDPNSKDDLPNSKWNNNGSGNGTNPSLGSGKPKNYNAKKISITVTDHRFLNAPNAVKKKRSEQTSRSQPENKFPPTTEPDDFTVCPVAGDEPSTGDADIKTKEPKEPKENGDTKEIRSVDEYEQHFREVISMFDRTGLFIIEKFSSNESDYVRFNPLKFSPFSENYKWCSAEYSRKRGSWIGERSAISVRITERKGDKSFMLLDWIKTKNEKSQTGGKILCLYYHDASRLNSNLVRKVLHCCATNIRVWLTDEQMNSEEELAGFKYTCVNHYFKNGASTTFYSISDFLKQFQFQINPEKQ